MGLITNGLFVELVDRIAAQTVFLQSGLCQARQEGSGYFFDRITTSDDYDVENDLISPGHALDINFLTGDTYRRIYSNFVSALERHVTSIGGARSMDAFLTVSGIQVADGFAQVYVSCKGSELLANNTFGPVVDNMGVIAFTGSGVSIFTDGDRLGDGGTTRHSDVPATGKPWGNHGSAPIKVVVMSGIGANDVIIQVTGLGSSGTITEQVTISGTAPVGGEVTLSQQYCDITGVQGAGGNTGDAVQFTSILNRVVVI